MYQVMKAEKGEIFVEHFENSYLHKKVLSTRLQNNVHGIMHIIIILKSFT